MQQVKPNLLFVHGAFKEHLDLIKILIDKGRFDRVNALIFNLFYLLVGETDSKSREFSATGMCKFRFEFGNFYSEYCYLEAREQLELFRDKFFIFLDECFPKPLDEEVLYE